MTSLYHRTYDIFSFANYTWMWTIMNMAVHGETSSTLVYM